MPASIRRIWVQLTADRKRFGILCSVFGVGLLLWARLIIVSNMTRTAVAEPAKSEMSLGTGKPAKGEKSGGTDKSGSKASKKNAGARRNIDAHLFSRCLRDPFVISPLHFPKLTDAKEVQREAGKLPTEAAEDASQKDARLVARLQELLGTLKLEAVMDSSPAAMAVISGKRYQVGDRISVGGPKVAGSERVQFTLVEVRERSVVLEFQGSPERRFEMVMSLPVSE